MSDDVDGFIATAPKLEFAFAIKARVGPIQDLGQAARGQPRDPGPHVQGELVPVGNYHFRTAPRFETAEPSLKWLVTSRARNPAAAGRRRPS
jgi:hypothetical protein